MDCRIRRAVPDDALNIAIVIAYTWKTTYSGLMPDCLIDRRIDGIREIAGRYQSDMEEGGNFLVAECGRSIVGACVFGASRNEHYADAGELFALYVLKGFQGAGVGRTLFAAGRRELAKDGRRSVIVNCLAGNPALGFYQKMGGSVVGRRQDRMGGEQITEEILLFDAPNPAL
jgi:ribosomal protein S18 acetylase RimI-like enzyme